MKEWTGKFLDSGVNDADSKASKIDLMYLQMIIAIDTHQQSDRLFRRERNEVDLWIWNVVKMAVQKNHKIEADKIGNSLQGMQ